MTAAWLVADSAALGLVLRATLLIGVAWTAAAALRKADASAATRHMVWLLGIAALLALPLFWWLAPPLRLPVLSPEAASAAAALPPPTSASAPATVVSMGWDAVLLLVYALGAAVLLLRFALCRHMVSRLWRDAEPARDAAWQGLLFRVSRETRLSRPVELRIARGPAMPMTWGTLAPKILLPAEARAWPPERRRLVLLHELAHVARYDSLGRSAASLACALYWFHPGAWFAARQMRMEQEYAADDRVLKAGAGARTYALSLLYLASRVEETSWPDHAAAMAGMCQLERRLVSITAPTHRERPGPAFLYASAAIAVVVTLAVAAAVPVRPLSALPESLRAAPALLAPWTGSEPAEAESEDQVPTQAERASRGEGEGARSRFEAARNAAPMSRAGPRAPETSAQRAEPPGPGLETPAHRNEPAWRDAPADGRQRAVYGPPPPLRDIDMSDDDARIPELVRRGGRGNNGNPEQRRRRTLPLGVSMSVEPGAPIRPGLMLSFGPGQP